MFLNEQNLSGTLALVGVDRNNTPVSVTVKQVTKFGKVFNIFRCSRGIKKPVPEIMKYSEVKKIVNGEMPHYSKSVMIYNDVQDRVHNIVTYEQYNLKRKKKPPK